MNIKPITTKENHELALARVESLWNAKGNTQEGIELNNLCSAIEAYEIKHFPMSRPDPIDAIKFRMKQQGLKPVDLVPMIGHRSKVSEVMNKKRKLNLAMIRRLHATLNIPLEILISDYKLAGKD